MLRSKQPSVSVVCFDRINALHSSTNLHTHRTIPFQNSVGLPAASCRRFGLFVASIGPSGRQFDRDSGSIHYRNCGLHRPNWSFPYFDPTPTILKLANLTTLSRSSLNIDLRVWPTAVTERECPGGSCPNACDALSIRLSLSRLRLRRAHVCFAGHRKHVAERIYEHPSNAGKISGSQGLAPDQRCTDN